MPHLLPVFLATQRCVFYMYVYEDECACMKDNNFLGKFELSGIPPAPSTCASGDAALATKKYDSAITTMMATQRHDNDNDNDNDMTTTNNYDYGYDYDDDLFSCTLAL
ncbi:uncharacterized protein EDB91DRAFT_1083644 [Suillus paluster]|uniref:uncharacterized protein n=1 Tax=Suillus paluster TaxID=48578 RepID=UPI001B876E73|nr:uncharacterized protein EDB91DRAFT_1083644 [Suillus paluster]KAG1735744.1 hypothetical protein EDB91DRAFT_1083644 [Suillus paluster]